MTEISEREDYDYAFVEEFKYLYESEIQHSDRLSNKIGSHLTMLTVIGSALVFLFFKALEVEHHDFLYLCFIVALTASSLLFIISIVFFFKAFSNYSYIYFPTGHMPDFFDRVKKSTLTIDQQKNYFGSMAARKYLDGAVHNRKQNARKNVNVYMASGAIIKTFGCVLATFTLWALIAA